MTVAAVSLWGRQVGAISDADGLPAFEYHPDWLASGRSISPIHLPLEKGVFAFPELRRQEAFEGLPGVFADSLPDRFGNRVIQAWLERQSPPIASISAAEKLLYMGHRAMGALEYQPARTMQDPTPSPGLELGALVEQARQIIQGQVASRLNEIMAAASSAGGVRAKALLGWNRNTDEVIANQAELPPGFEHWIFKFDGMGDDGRPQHWCRLEYAYYLMARAAGITISESTLVRQGELAHFATRRFDRSAAGKVHAHSLCGLQHADYNQPNVWSYEMYLRSCLKLGLGMDELGEAWRRMVFNVLARNQDDHSKNFSFLLDEGAEDWRLAPAFDLTHANGAGWTRTHQLSVNGKFQGMGRDDLQAVADLFGIRRWRDILAQVHEALAKWPEFAGRAGLDGSVIESVAAEHRSFPA